MTDTDLFIHSAEIAGVFVGFGALIAVRSGATMAVGEINDIRWVVTVGIWVVIVALAPIFIASYGLDGHELWLVSSLLALALLAAILVVFARTPENRAELATNLAAVPLRKIALVMGTSFWPSTAAGVLSLALVVLVAFPDQEQALYLSAVGLGLLMATLALFVTVFWAQRPSTWRAPRSDDDLARRHDRLATSSSRCDAGHRFDSRSDSQRLRPTIDPYGPR